MAPLLLSLSSEPAAARRSRTRSAAKPEASRSLLEPALALPSDEAIEADLRDAPAALPGPAWLRRAEPATMILEVSAEPAPAGAAPAEENASRVPMDPIFCSAAAKNLRFMIRAAADASREHPDVVRKRLGSGLRRELTHLRRREPADDARVSLLTTDAEMELEGALKTLEAGKLSRPALKSYVLGPATKAARNLELAARHLAP